MDKKLVVVGIVVLLLVVGLSGCIFEDEEKFIILPDGIKVKFHKSLSDW